MKYCLTACSQSRCTEKADIYRVLWKAVRLFRRPVRADSVLGALVLPVKIVAAAGQHECLLMGRARPPVPGHFAARRCRAGARCWHPVGCSLLTRLDFIQREETEFSAPLCCGEEESRFGRRHIPRCSFGCVVALGRIWAQAAAAPAEGGGLGREGACS